MRPLPGARAACPCRRLPVVCRRSCARAEEVRSGRDRHRDQDRQHQPYSGPASAYGTIGRAEAAYFKMINDQGGINGRKINFISLDDGYSPPRTVEQIRKLVEEEQVLFLAGTLGTPHQHGDPQVRQRQEGAAHLRQHRRHQVGRSEELPLDHGVQPELPGRGRTSTRSTSWRTSRTRRSPSSTRTTTTARTTSRASRTGWATRRRR